MDTDALRRREHVRTEEINGTTVVNFLDRRIFDDEKISIIAEQLFSLVDCHGKTDILLDFNNVFYLSAAFLGKLIIFRTKLCEERAGTLVLCNMVDPIYEVFEITKLNKMFKIVKSKQKALTMF